MATDPGHEYAHELVAAALAAVFALFTWLIKRTFGGFADTQKEQAERLDSHGERIAKVEGFLGLD